MTAEKSDRYFVQDSCRDVSQDQGRHELVAVGEIPQYQNALGGRVGGFAGGGPHVIPIADLHSGNSPCSTGEDMDHVRTWAQAELALPPILVHKGTMRVIDSMSRLRAAQLRGADTIEVRYFDGGDDAAFVLAVERNTVDGLPLTLVDREAAAIRILHINPQWLDQGIARVAGLSARTVAGLRRSAADMPRLNERVGDDGKVRPVDSREGRLRAGELIARRPETSLRESAKSAGISVAKRKRLAIGNPARVSTTSGRI